LGFKIFLTTSVIKGTDFVRSKKSKSPSR